MQINGNKDAIDVVVSIGTPSEHLKAKIDLGNGSKVQGVGGGEIHAGENMADTTQITYKSELARKSIHLSSLGIPFVYLRIPHETGMAILAVMTLVSVIIDAAMHYHTPTRTLMFKLVGPLLRGHERQRDRFLLTGASWVLIAAFITLAVFPTIVAVTAFTVLIVSDTFAALIGRRYGRLPFLDKSVVGTVTFIITAWVVVVFYDVVYALPWTFLLAGAVGSVVGGIIEAGSIRLRLDDNLSIPFSIAVTMMVIAWLSQVFSLPNFLDYVP